jgi:Na+/melibiose symporter-like transporter
MKTIFSIIVLIADIYAVLQILRSSATLGKKILWILGVIIFPVLGFIVWYFAGPGRKP